MTEKGRCKHGEFILQNGCTKCISEMQGIAIATEEMERAFVKLEEVERNQTMVLVKKKLKTSAHIRYKNNAGDIVPGVTTIIGLLAKPQLIVWANRLGLQGIDSTKYRDDKGDIGTLAHSMIISDLRGEKCDTSDYSQQQIDKAENCYLSWLEWRKHRELKPVGLELPLVSEEYQFGGTVDYYGLIDGVTVLVDFKTGGVWPEATIQTCAYRHLLIENGYPTPSHITILGIPRTEDESFQEKVIINFDTGWEIFRHLRAVYNLNKQLK